MNDSIIPPRTSSLAQYKATAIDGLSKKSLFSLLQHLKWGQLIIVEGTQSTSFGRPTDDFTLEATIHVHNPNFYSSAMLGGSIGSAEAYMSGWWSADDLTTLMRIIARNEAVFMGMDKGWARLSKPLRKAFHLLRKNSRKGSRANIVAHYDLGNAFYSLFLDETLTYSCGIFENENSTLKDASLAKYERICRKLQLQPDDHVLEIGSGWGGFSLYAVKNYGCRITTTTISDEQYGFARELFENEGVSDRIRLLKQDYRDLTGSYDKLVSIEMIEAVGHHFLDDFFRVCSRRLKQDGMMLLQAITIIDHAFDRHKRSVDFIKRYIFPGSCIPSIAAMGQSIAGETDMRLFHLEDITPHYARTLRTWRERFFSNIERVRAMGFADSFIRMWEYYLSYCEGGFAERYLGDVQMLLTKPLCRREPILTTLERG